MIEDKEIPNEFISIRQAWIKAIDRVSEAIAYRYRNDVHDPDYSSRIGQQIVIESVIALSVILVDFGECPIKTEVKRWRSENKKRIEERSQKNYFWYRDLFEFIVETLNKYGMLFDSQPKGFSNVVMKEIKEEK